MRTLFVSLSLLFCACGPLLEGEVQIAELCRDLEPIDVPASPTPVDAALTYTEPVVLPAQLDDPALSERELRLTSVTLTVDGLPDLSFVRGGEVNAILEGGTERFEWTNPDPAAKTITLTPAAPLDVSSALSAGQTEVQLTLDATTPTQAFRLTPRVCFQGAIAAEWTP